MWFGGHSYCIELSVFVYSWTSLCWDSNKHHSMKRWAAFFIDELFKSYRDKCRTNLKSSVLENFNFCCDMMLLMKLWPTYHKIGNCGFDQILILLNMSISILQVSADHSPVCFGSYLCRTTGLLSSSTLHFLLNNFSSIQVVPVALVYNNTQRFVLYLFQ